MARYTGPVCRLCRREGHEALPEGQPLLHQEVPVRAAARRRPASTAPPPQGRRLRPPASREAEGPPRLRRPREASSATTSRGRAAAPASPARTCCARSSRGSTTSSSGWASRRRAPQARQLVSHGHFAVNGGRPTSRPTSSSRATGSRSATRTTSASCSRSSRNAQPHQAPDWLSVDAGKLTGTVIALPRRDQMPLDLNEQLVVEYYSR